MTFEKWWKDNQDDIKNNISSRNFTRIFTDFEACWHDGYLQGYRHSKFMERFCKHCAVAGSEGR